MGIDIKVESEPMTVATVLAIRPNGFMAIDVRFPNVIPIQKSSSYNTKYSLKLVLLCQNRTQYG